MKEQKLFHHLHQHKYLWQECTKRDVVVRAWKKLRKGKTKRAEVIKIESDFEHYVDLMIEMIQNTRPDSPYPEKGYKAKILKPKHIVEHGKARIIYCPPIWDQWVHHIIIQVLAPIVMKYSYKFSCGSMPKRGGVYGRRELERVIKKKGFKYFAKLDICHFFNSVTLDVVIKELNVFIEDDWFMYLIMVVFEQFKKGLPLGFYISQWLANFVLCRVDQLIRRLIPTCYIRYMDDFVIADNNKKFLHNMIIKIKKCLGRNLRLKLKRNYQVIRFEYVTKLGKTIGRKIDFMGYKFGRENVILRKRIMLRAVRNAKHLKECVVISVRQAQAMLSRLGWFKYTDTKYLFIKMVQPNISIRSLKLIVSKKQRRYNYENGLDRGAMWPLTGAIRAA